MEATSTTSKHKETSSSFVNKFISDCQKVDAKVLTNPFSQQTFIKLNSSYIYPEVIVNNSEKVFKIGLEQYQDFCKTRFVDCSEDVILSKITKNDLKLPKDAQHVQIECPCLKITESMFIKFRDACVHRSDAAKESFVNEISGAPECFLDKKAQEPYHNAKSSILDCIVKEYITESPNADGLVIDLSLIVRAQVSVILKRKTFDDLCGNIFNNIVSIGEKYRVSRIDMVADQYSQKSIKSPTRSLRKGKTSSSELQITGSSVVPEDIAKNFITNEQNKKQLNNLLDLQYLS